MTDFSPTHRAATNGPPKYLLPVGHVPDGVTDNDVVCLVKVPLPAWSGMNSAITGPLDRAFLWQVKSLVDESMGAVASTLCRAFKDYEVGVGPLPAFSSDYSARTEKLLDEWRSLREAMNAGLDDSAVETYLTENVPSFLVRMREHVTVVWPKGEPCGDAIDWCHLHAATECFNSLLDQRTSSRLPLKVADVASKVLGREEAVQFYSEPIVALRPLELEMVLAEARDLVSRLVLDARCSIVTDYFKRLENFSRLPRLITKIDETLLLGKLHDWGERREARYAAHQEHPILVTNATSDSIVIVARLARPLWEKADSFFVTNLKGSLRLSSLFSELGVSAKMTWIPHPHRGGPCIRLALKFQGDQSTPAQKTDYDGERLSGIRYLRSAWSQNADAHFSVNSRGRDIAVSAPSAILSSWASARHMIPVLNQLRILSDALPHIKSAAISFHSSGPYDAESFLRNEFVVSVNMCAQSTDGVHREPSCVHLEAERFMDSGLIGGLE